MVEEKRECELKYKILGIEEENNLIDEIKLLGFKYEGENLESDYTPDVEGFLCRKNGLMLRYRVIEGVKNDVLITLKIKGNSKKFQDNYEIETLVSNFNIENFNKINEILYEVTKNKISLDIIKLKSINEIMQYLKKSPFRERRMFTQKKRKEFIYNENIKITIDEFPKNIGKYLEIETKTPEKLFEIVEKLKLNKNNIEKRNYGEIIKEQQKDLPEKEKRTCVFNKYDN